MERIAVRNSLCVRRHVDNVDASRDVVGGHAMCGGGVALFHKGGEGYGVLQGLRAGPVWLLCVWCVCDVVVVERVEQTAHRL